MSTPELVIMFILGLIILVPGWIFMPRYWRGSVRPTDSPLIDAVAGKHGSGGANALFPTAIGTLTLGCLGVILATIDDKWFSDSWSTVLTPVWATMLSLSVTGLFLAVSIFLFLRPRFLVPPRLRNRKGLVQALWASRGSPPKRH